MQAYDTLLDCQSLSSDQHPFFQHVVRECIGHNDCILRDLKTYLPVGNQAGQFSGCHLQEDSSLFIQFKCRVSQDDLFQKRKVALSASTLVIFTTISMLFIIKFAEQSQKLE